MFHNFFSGIGIDISDHHVRLARVSFFNKILGLKEIKLPEGLMEDEKAVQTEEIKKLIEQGLKEWKLPAGSFKTTVLVPESRVFFTNVVLDKKISGSSLDFEAKNLAQRDIPIPFNQTCLTITKGEISNESQLINVYACQKEIIDGLKTSVDLPFFRLIAMETNSKALLRLFNRFVPETEKAKFKNDLVGMVDIGHNWTTVSVYSSSFGSLLFSRTLSYDDLIEKDDKTQILSQKTVELVIETMKEVNEFFLKQDKKIALFLLAGVEMTGKDVLTACQKEEKLFSVIPIGQILQIPNLASADIHRFGPAIGAAYRSLFSWRHTYQHNFLNCPDPTPDQDS